MRSSKHIRIRLTLVKLFTLTLGLLIIISVVNVKPVSGQRGPQRPGGGGQQRPGSQAGQIFQQQQNRLGQRPGAAAGGQQRPLAQGRPWPGQGGGIQRPGMRPGSFGGGPGGGGPGFGPGAGGGGLNDQVEELREELVQQQYELEEVKEEVKEIPDAVVNEMENHGDFADDYTTDDGVNVQRAGTGSYLTMALLALVTVINYRVMIT